jgi:hypothetical protein
MKRKMSVRDKLFLQAYLSGKPLNECAKLAGSQGKDVYSLCATGLKWLKSLEIEFDELMDMKGLTDEKLLQGVLDGTTAKKQVVATWEGAITDVKEFDDMPTREKYLQLLGRMKGRFIDRHELSGKDGGDIILSVKPSKPRKEPLTLDLDD